MSALLQDVRTDFDWLPQPAGAQLVGRLLKRCIQSNPQISALSGRMRDETGTRLVDWIDSWAVADDTATRQDLAAAGYKIDDADPTCWRHPEGIFPVVRLLDGAAMNGASPDWPLSLAIKVSSVEDFAAAFGVKGEIQGAAGSQ